MPRTFSLIVRGFFERRGRVMESVINKLSEFSIEQIKEVKRRIIREKSFKIRHKITFLKLCNRFIRYKRRQERGKG